MKEAGNKLQGAPNLDPDYYRSMNEKVIETQIVFLSELYVSDYLIFFHSLGFFDKIQNPYNNINNAEEIF